MRNKISPEDYLNSKPIRFDGDIIITDPCYILPEGMPKNILSPYIERNTLCGDWRCITINSDSKSIIGEFCADTSRVCVAYLADVLKYSPDFLGEYSIHCRTIIKNFHGTIRAFVSEKDSSYSLIIKAKGNVNFITKRVE